MRTLVTYLALLVAIMLAACSDDRACATDAECFSGEVCTDEACVVGTRPAPNSEAADMGSETDASRTRDVSTDMRDNANAGPDASALEACQVDLFGNSCDDDDFEENDLYTQELPIPIAADSWCLGDALTASTQSFSGTLCPGDRADLFRILVDNRMPNECLAETLTVRMIVQLDEPCDPMTRVRIVPYLSFENPNTNSSCGQSDDLRCTVSDDSRTHTFEWVRSAESLLDQRLFIGPRESDTQVDYTVTVEIIQ